MSKIIKASELGLLKESSTKRIDKKLEKNTANKIALNQAVQIVEVATKRSSNLISTAENDVVTLVQREMEKVEMIKETARQEGFQVGYAEGFAQGQIQGAKDFQEEFKAVLTSISDGIEQLSQLRQEILKKSETELVKIAILIAERLVRNKFEDPKTTIDISRALLSEIEDDSMVTLFLPPDIANMPEVKEKILAGKKTGVRFEIMADSNLEPGDVRIETQWGWIDGRGAIRWSRLIRALQEDVQIDEGLCQ